MDALLNSFIATAPKYTKSSLKIYKFTHLTKIRNEFQILSDFTHFNCRIYRLLECPLNYGKQACKLKNRLNSNTAVSCPLSFGNSDLFRTCLGEDDRRSWAERWFLSSFAFFVFSAAGESSAAVFCAFALGLWLELFTTWMNPAFEDSHNRRDV